MNAVEHLYNEEQKLLKRLLKSESKEQQEAIKRIIGRINKDMESLDI